MPHGSMERNNDIIEVHTTWLYYALLTVINTKKRCFAAETSAEVYGWRIHSALESTSSNFACYGKSSIIHYLRTFGCEIFPIKPPPKSYTTVHKKDDS